MISDHFSSFFLFFFNIKFQLSIWLSSDFIPKKKWNSGFGEEAGEPHEGHQSPEARSQHLRRRKRRSSHQSCQSLSLLVSREKVDFSIVERIFFDDFATGVLEGSVHGSFVRDQAQRVDRLLRDRQRREGDATSRERLEGEGVRALEKKFQ